MWAIKTTSFTKQYKKLTAVDNLNLEIQQGELFSLLGVNGAGKTTTIKMLTGLTKPSGGEAIVGGYSISKQLGEIKQLIGVSPQETAVAPNLSVIENLELSTSVKELGKNLTVKAIDDTSILSVSVKDLDAGQSARIACPPAICRFAKAPGARG